MIIFAIYFCFFLPSILRAEQPLSVCPGWHPFKTKENSCVNFLEICVKKGDPECDTALGACQQCPASNYSVLAYSEIVNMKYDIKNNKEETVIIKTMFESINRKKDLFLTMTTLLLIITIISVLLSIAILICLFIEVRFKLITKSIESRLKKKSRNNLDSTETSPEKYPILKSRKSEIQKDFVTKSILDESLRSLDFVTKSILDESLRSLDFVTMSILDESLRSLEVRLNRVFQQIDKSKGKSKCFINFKINGHREIWGLKLSNTDSVVHIKKQICNKWLNAKAHFYKIMSLKQNGTIFDNNQYLLPFLMSREDTVDCEIDESIDYEQIVILQIKGNVHVPDLIQVERNKRIEELKQIINASAYSRDIAILKGCEELKDEFTIEYYNLKDDDSISIVKRESGKLVIRSVLKENEPIDIEYSNIDPIYSIYHKIANKFNYDDKNIFLFLNDECLNEYKIIYEYNINSGSMIKYYYLIKLNGIKSGKCIDKGYFSELLKGKNNKTDTDLLLLKFVLKVGHFKPDGEVIKTLIQSQIRNAHRLFLQVQGIYSDESHFYVGLEYMEQGTLKNYLNKHPNVTDDQIKSWSKQILEYLQYIHRNGYIYIDLKPYDIFVDNNGNLKMHSIILYKYFYDTSRKDIIEMMVRNKDVPSTHLAPEVRKGDPYDKSADVWSFGVILIYILIGECPEIDQEEVESDILKYQFPPGRSNKLKELIDSCVKIDPKERSTIDELIQNSFLNKL